MDKFNELKELLASIEADAESFYTKGNKAAGTRVRTGFQKVKNLAQEIRTQVTELKNKEK